jgi:hypothetical protein
VQFTCLFLATKVADQVHALGLLRFMLTNLSHNGAVVTMQQAANVEARCLEALEWRLGPFFSEDELTGEKTNESISEVGASGMEGLSECNTTSLWFGPLSVVLPTAAAAAVQCSAWFRSADVVYLECCFKWLG